METKATQLAIVVLVASIAFMSCGKKTNCKNIDLYVSFPNDSNLHIVSQYRQDGNFKTSYRSDSFYYYYRSSVRLFEGYDWLISCPAKNKEYKITQISYQQKTERLQNSTCTNDLHYNINGVQHYVRGRINGEPYESINVE